LPSLIAKEKSLFRLIISPFGPEIFIKLSPQTRETSLFKL
jgi:hypothetical protein